ncbi:group 1 truncated hemoglobin [Microbacterium sp. AZCO]|uniref:group I truncated hemoglobin n=1 Tax=Microbacterium sp. AZCO TaxID=3142976 RepID=UPI0031F3A651
MAVYDEIGGAASVKAAVSVFYDRVLADPSVSPWFDGIDIMRLKSHQRAFLAAALGGPELFSGRDLASAHAGRDITDEGFDTIVEHLTTSLHDLGVADDVVTAVRERVEPLREDVVTA